MPFINISTSSKVDDKDKLLKEISILIASLTKKSQKFVMARLEDESKLFFNDEGPCCYFQIKSIGSMNSHEMTKPICEFIHEKIGIPIDRIYICFEDINPKMWGWNGRTFG